MKEIWAFLSPFRLLGENQISLCEKESELAAFGKVTEQMHSRALDCAYLLSLFFLFFCLFFFLSLFSLTEAWLTAGLVGKRPWEKDSVRESAIAFRLIFHNMASTHTHTMTGVAFLFFSDGQFKAFSVLL